LHLPGKMMIFHQNYLIAVHLGMSRPQKRDPMPILSQMDFHEAYENGGTKETRKIDDICCSHESTFHEWKMPSPKTCFFCHTEMMDW